MSLRGLNLDRKFIAEIGDQYELGSEPDLFGVEVELEGRNLKTQKAEIAKWWTMHEDHSLRAFLPGSESTEYVIKKPLTMADTKLAVMALFEYLTKNPGTEVFESYRTSIHVHVNCLQETNRTIANYITLAIIFDELFVSQNGETRIGNNFCLRSRDAEGQLEDLIKAVTVMSSFTNLHGHNRYSSVNFVSLAKFGTIEFRSLECTADYNRLLHWIDTLQVLKQKAREFDNPMQIMSKFSSKGPVGFMISMLGDQYVKYAMVPNNQMMLRNGMRIAQDFAYCCDWSGPQEVKDAPRRKSGQGAYENALHAYDQAQQAAQPLYQMNNGWANPAGAQPFIMAKPKPKPPMKPKHVEKWVYDANGVPKANPKYPNYAIQFGIYEAQLKNHQTALKKWEAEQAVVAQPGIFPVQAQWGHPAPQPVLGEPGFNLNDVDPDDVVEDDEDDDF